MTTYKKYISYRKMEPNVPKSEAQCSCILINSAKTSASEISRAQQLICGNSYLQLCKHRATSTSYVQSESEETSKLGFMLIFNNEGL